MVANDPMVGYISTTCTIHNHPASFAITPTTIKGRVLYHTLFQTSMGSLASQLPKILWELEERRMKNQCEQSLLHIDNENKTMTSPHQTKNSSWSYRIFLMC
eukprot:scaffold19220_cov180-Amphora_coffeaeformis.AAC.2